MQPKLAMLAAGYLNQQEENNIRIYIFKFEKLQIFFKNNINDKITIKMFLNRVRKGIKTHALNLKNQELLWDLFLSEVQYIDNMKPRKIEIKSLKRSALTVEEEKD